MSMVAMTSASWWHLFLHELQVCKVSGKSHLTLCCQSKSKRGVIPPEYKGLKEIFSMEQVNQPLHWPYDCTLGLLLRTVPPWVSYYLFLKRGLYLGCHGAHMTLHIFCWCCDGTLHFCIDYWKLNHQKSSHLPFMRMVFERLQQVLIFTQMYLHSGYNLFHICEGDEWKITFLHPSGHFMLVLLGWSMPPFFRHSSMTFYESRWSNSV